MALPSEEPQPPRPVPFVEHAAIVQGQAAVGLAMLLYFATTRGGLTGLPDQIRSATLGALEAVDLASRAHVRRVSATGRTEARPVPAAPLSIHEPLSVTEAATALGLTERRVRDLAAAGLGYKVGGRWVLDRTSVDRERERRSA